MTAITVSGLSYRHLPGDHAVCRLPASARVTAPDHAVFWCQLLAGGEITIYCRSEHRPDGADVASGWALLELDGSFDFDVVGVMAAWTAPLAAAGIAVMALSSFATDYLLVKHDRLADAHVALARAGIHPIA